MAKKKPTKAESDHMGLVAALGCIACLNMGIPDSPALIHHTRFNVGASQRASHFSTLGLCFHHHAVDGVDGFHAAPASWQEVHGSELKLLRQVYELLNLNIDDFLPELKGVSYG